VLMDFYCIEVLLGLPEPRAFIRYSLLSNLRCLSTAETPISCVPKVGHR
jgi:hypothetical protein